MRPTPRFWATVGVGLVLSLLALAAQNVRLVYAVGTLSAWMFVTALVATRTFLTQGDALTVEYALAAETTLVETPATATLAVTRSATHPACRITATCASPPGVTIDGDEVTVAATETAGTATLTVTPAVVGTFALPQPTLRLEGPLGYFTETITRGPAPTIDVVAETPETLHVGQGGQSQVAVYGEHKADQAGPGLLLRELRQYQPGEPADRIDWKATARLGDPYVRETEAETDRRTALVVDHGSHMRHGDDGTTMVAAASEVALGITQQAATVGDPVGLWTVGDEGLTTAIEPASTPRTRRRIRQRLLGLTPTEATAATVGRSPSVARRYAAALADAEPHSAFAETVQPYFAASDPYVHRLREAPFVETVRQVYPSVGDGGLLVLVTSDHDRVGIREAVRIAVQGTAHVFVFLAPTALYVNTDSMETGRYDEYVGFETFRKQLDRHPQVTAFEIAPKTRLDALLAARRTDPTEDAA